MLVRALWLNCITASAFAGGPSGFSSLGGGESDEHRELARLFNVVEERIASGIFTGEASGSSSSGGKLDDRRELTYAERLLFDAVKAGDDEGVRDAVLACLNDEAKNSDINALDEGGRTALILAVYNKETYIVDLLLRGGARVDAVDKDGWSALMWAAYMGFAGIVERLLDAGADIYIVGKDGVTALDIAKSGRFPETERVLRSHVDRELATTRSEHNVYPIN